MRTIRAPRCPVSYALLGDGPVDRVIELNKTEINALRRAAKILTELDDRAQAADPYWEDGADARTDIVIAEMTLIELAEAGSQWIGEIIDETPLAR